MFDADRPIVSSKQDRLNRSLFARYLARCMLDHQDPESLVIGLYGSWGSGKTSLINLITEELNHASSNMLDADRPIILNFSPWSYSGQNQLVYSFFRRLSSALRGVNYLEDADRIIYLLELYVSFFTHKPIPTALQKKKHWYSSILKSKHNEDIHGWESGRDLTSVKAELNQLLRGQKHKIIITIDNISRLYDDEIKQMFQIIKSMGDYVNTIYLLALDKQHVIHALNSIDGGNGDEYLEKIVQLPFDVPPITQQDLEAIFSDRLGSIVATTPDGTWNTEYWADVYYHHIKYFFKSCRDITHYANVVNFGYSRVRDIVNPVDFFAITAIQLFEPNIYSSIRENKDLFSDLLDHVYQIDENEREKDKKRCDELLSHHQSLDRGSLLQLLMQLFPRLRRLYEPDVPFYHSDRIAGKLKRICSPDFFDIYFRLSMPTSLMHQDEFNTILSFASDAAAFDQAITRLNQDSRILPFIDHLDDSVKHKLSDNASQGIINALLDNGDLLPDGVDSKLSLTTAMRIHRIIHSILTQYDDQNKRFEILQTAINAATKSIYSIVHELSRQEFEHLEESDTYIPLEFRDLNPAHLELLKQLAITKIKNWADTGRLIDYPKALPVLLAWHNWGNPDECKKFIKLMTDSDRGLIAFLSAIFETPITQAMTKYEKNPDWMNYLSDIDTFIPHRELEKHAKELFEDAFFEKLREREQLALMIFLDITQTKTEKIIPNTTA